MEKTMDKIVALAKSRGFIYPGSEIYGGLANTWDYGNLGVELKTVSYTHLDVYKRQGQCAGSTVKTGIDRCRNRF